jgi:putative ABC transport system permease protein
MHIFTYIRQEISFRSFNFVAGLLSIVLAMSVWCGAPSLLRAQQRQTEQLLQEREEATRQAMRKMEDDYRRIMLDLGHNVMILAAEENLARLQQEGYPAFTMPESNAETLALTGDVKSLNHILPILQQKVRWPERDTEIILSGTRGQIPTPHRKRHWGADGRRFLHPIMPAVAVGEIKIGSGLAEQYGLQVGDRVDVLGESFLLREILPSEGSRQDVTIWCHLDWMQEKLQLQGRISMILALECVCHADELGQIVREIKQWIPEVQVVEFSSRVKTRAQARARAAEIHQEAIAEFKQQREALFALQRRLAGIAIPASLLASGLWIFFLFLGNVRERRQEMGILRAVGASESTLLLLFLLKSLGMGLLGAALGFFLGHSLAVNSIASSWWSPHWYELLRWRELLTALLASPSLCVLAAWVPAFRASRIDPASMLMDH